MRIGEALVKSGLIKQEALESALEEQKQTHNRLGEILLQKGLVCPTKLDPFLAEYFQVPYINLKDIYKNIPAEVVEIIPYELAKRFRAVPLELQDLKLTVAIADPLNLQALDILRIKTGYKIKCAIAKESDILEAVEYWHQGLSRMNACIENFTEMDVQSASEDELLEEDSEKLISGANNQPIIQYVRSLIIQAVNSGASDIHINPKQKKPN